MTQITETTIRKKIIRKNKLVFLQKAHFEKVHGNDDKAAVWLELSAIWSGPIEKNLYTKQLLNPKTIWSNNNYLNGTLPGSFPIGELSKNFCDMMGIDISQYALTDNEVEFIKLLLLKPKKK